LTIFLRRAAGRAGRQERERQTDAKGEALLGVPDKGVDDVQDVQLLHEGGNGALASGLGIGALLAGQHHSCMRARGQKECGSAKLRRETVCPVRPHRRPGHEHRHQHCGACVDGAQRARVAGEVGSGGVGRNADNTGGGQVAKERVQPDAAKALVHELSTQRAAIQRHGL